MKIAIALLFVLNSFLLSSQNTFLVTNAQLNSLLDKSTFPELIDFQFSTRLSIGFQIPLYYDSIKQIEKTTLELGVGRIFSGLYYKNSPQTNPRSSMSGGDISGLFLKLEPSYNFWQNKKKNLLLSGSLNNVIYVFGNYKSETIFLKKDSSEVTLITENAKYKLQYAAEIYIGASYILRTKNGLGYMFRLKSGYAFHYIPIAKMRLSDENEISSIELNNFNLQLSIGFLLNKKE